MRPLLLYLRSRHIPIAAFATVGVVACLAWVAQSTDHSRGLSLVAVLTGAAASGPGLAGHDIDLDRAAARRWSLWRSVHIAVACAVVIGVTAAPALVVEPFAPIGQVARDAVGLFGLAAMAAATFGAQRAWIPPVTWSLLSMTVLPRLWPPGETTIYERIATWMIQPCDGKAATIVALTLGVAGTITYARWGPRQ